MSFTNHNIPTQSHTQTHTEVPAPPQLYFSSYRPPTLTMSKRPSSIALYRPSSPSSHMPKPKPWSGSDTLKKSKVDHTIQSWNLKEEKDSLPEIPFYQVPSNTFVVIQETNPQAVAQRIADAVARMSSVGNYNDELSTATIHTITNVKLSIGLFRTSDDKILVELLRVNGDVMGFHRAARVILAAAQNMPLSANLQATATAGTAGTPSTSRQIATVTPIRRERSTLIRQGQVDVVSSTMEKIQSLMKKDRMDAVLLGMESLELLVNASSSKQETVLSASKAILCNGGIWQDVKDVLFGLVMDRNMHLNSGGEGTDQAEYDSKYHLALTILANALDCISIYTGQHPNGDGIDIAIDMEEMKDLLSALKEYMEEYVSSSSPSSSSKIMNHVHVQGIYQAARCIRSLIDLSPELRTAALDIGIIDVANELLMGGASRHQLLANVSEKIVSVLAEAQPKQF